MDTIKKYTPTLIFVLGHAIYWSTAYPTITWWDSSDYSAAAACLGLTPAPGSFLLTVLVCCLTKLIPLPAAYLFNLFAGTVPAFTVSISFIVALNIRTADSEKGDHDISTVGILPFILAAGFIFCSKTL